MREKNSGVGIGMVVCGLILLAFPNFVGLSGWPAWIFDGLGLVLLLMGVMGACVEIFRG